MTEKLTTKHQPEFCLGLWPAAVHFRRIYIIHTQPENESGWCEKMVGGITFEDASLQAYTNIQL